MHEAGLAVSHRRFQADVMVDLVRLFHGLVCEVPFSVLARALDKKLLVIG